MSPGPDDTVTIREWDLEDIERELLDVANEATHLAPSPTAEKITACNAAALATVWRLLGRE